MVAKSRYIKMFLKSGAFLLGASISLGALGQEINCTEEDGFCLQRLMEISCREEGSSRSACEAWLSRLQAHVNAPLPVWRLSEAWTYKALADFAHLPALTDFGSVSKEEAQRFEISALEIFREVVRRAPQNSEALLSLSTVVENPEERNDLLKRVVSLDPENFIATESLANSLFETRGDAAFDEMADLLKGSFDKMVAGPNKWRLGAKAVSYLKRSGNQSALDNFKEEISTQTKFDISISEVLSLEEEAINSITKDWCDTHIIDLFGHIQCVDLIVALSNSIPEAPASIEAEARVLTVIVGIQLGAGSRTLQLGLPEWEVKFKAIIEKLISANYQLPELFNAQADFLPQNERIVSLEKAVGLAPLDGGYRYRLALWFLEAENYPEAIAHFEASKSLLPPSRSGQVDEMIEIARTRLVN